MASFVPSAYTAPRRYRPKELGERIFSILLDWRGIRDRAFSAVSSDRSVDFTKKYRNSCKFEAVEFNSLLHFVSFADSLKVSQGIFTQGNENLLKTLNEMMLYLTTLHIFIRPYDRYYMHILTRVRNLIISSDLSGRLGLDSSLGNIIGSANQITTISLQHIFIGKSCHFAGLDLPNLKNLELLNTKFEDMSFLENLISRGNIENLKIVQTNTDLSEETAHFFRILWGHGYILQNVKKIYLDIKTPIEFPTEYLMVCAPELTDMIFYCDLSVELYFIPNFVYFCKRLQSPLRLTVFEVDKAIQIEEPHHRRIYHSNEGAISFLKQELGKTQTFNDVIYATTDPRTDW